MKILVCMKQVPQKDAPLKLNEAAAWIREDVSYEVNEPDAFALEEALRQKEKHTGEVVVITSGPARSQQVLREALAKGADRAIHLEDNAFVGLDALNTAKAFAAAIKDEKFDLIFTGLQSDDYGYAQTGVVLAELLGWPHATIIMQIEKTDSGIKVKRELEAGFFQFVDMPLPAVLTIQSGINKLRYATLMGIKKAKTKETKTVTSAAAGPKAVTLEVAKMYEASPGSIRPDACRPAVPNAVVAARVPPFPAQWWAVRGHQAFAGTPAHGFGMVGSFFGTAFSTTLPVTFG